MDGGSDEVAKEIAIDMKEGLRREGAAHGCVKSSSSLLQRATAQQTRSPVRQNVTVRDNERCAILHRAARDWFIVTLQNASVVADNGDTESVALVAGRVD